MSEGQIGDELNGDMNAAENVAMNHNKYYEQRQQRRLKEKKAREERLWEFPQLISSHNNYKVPALEFSKLLCKNVFGLDPAFHQEAQALRKNLLTLVHCREFSNDATSGLEPALIMVLPDMICENCQDC